VTQAAAKRQPTDTRVADDSAGRCQPVLLGRAVELAPEDAPRRPRGTRRAIDDD
jgi:hypothetical protein